MSWLNSTRADSTHAPLVAEIERLQKELDRANDSIDDKLDKLEDAGLGVVGLTKKLEEARGRIRTLESELSRLSRQEERRVKRLQRLRCQKCKVKVDVSHVNANERFVMSVFARVIHAKDHLPVPSTLVSASRRYLANPQRRRPRLPTRSALMSASSTRSSHARRGRGTTSVAGLPTRRTPSKMLRTGSMRRSGKKQTGQPRKPGRPPRRP